MSGRAYRLKGNETPSEGIRRIALGRAGKAIEELDRASGAEDLADSIHAARKDLKKLRAVVRLVRAELGDDLYRAENGRYRDAGRLLGRSRDAEVKVETLDALRERYVADLPLDLIAAWLIALEGERDEIGERFSREQGESALAEARAAIEGGQEEIPRWPLDVDSWQLVEPGLLRTYRCGRRAMKSACAEPTGENVHEWRKRTKDLWYQLRVVRDAWRPVLDETADQAHELADLLGDHHDLTVLADDLAGRELTGNRDAVTGVIESRQEGLLEEAAELGARLFAEKPKAFGRRLESYWLAWRSG
jgi:CHAD domain-containing protein